MKNKHQRAFALLFALLLAIGLTTTSLAFTSVIQPLSDSASIAPAAPEYVSFTPQITYTDAMGEVGVPSACIPPSGAGLSGWDMDETAFRYNREDDELLIGVSMWNNVIAGDPENNGNPGTTHSCLSGVGGTDLSNLGGSEGIDIILDTDNDGTYEYIAGIPTGSDIASLTVANYAGEATPSEDNIGQGYGTSIANSATLLNNPSSSARDYEFRINNFSDLFTGLDAGDTLSFCFIARAGSGADGGFGEDIFPNSSCQEITFSAEYDYGDLPAPYTETRHILDGETYLGTLIDAENSNQPNDNALGDDNNGSDDEDGVTFLTPLIPGETANVEIITSRSGYLNAWIDYEGDDDFTGNQIATDRLLGSGTNNLSFVVPTTVTTDTIYARFRFTKNEDEATTATALNGEVEDYALMSLGDVVWADNGAGGGTKNNGIQDGTEPGVNGVRVDLYRSDTFVGRTTTTDTLGTDGQYYFRGLRPGNYTVRVIAPNFVGSQPLQGYISSLGNGSANANIDLDDNGIDHAAPATNGISSGLMTLALGTEPQGSDNTNATLDFGFVTFTPTLALTKTVYLGDDDGVGCVTGAGSDLVQATNGTTVTYCFEVTNTSPDGDVWLNNITIDDAALGINQNDLMAPMTNTITNTVLLTPTGTNYYYYVTTIDGDLINTATAQGRPATSGGQALIGLPNVTDTDSAEVDEVTPGIDLQKTVYFGNNNGASCPGSELVTNVNAADITYCLEITNTGDTYLDNFTLTDTLNITEADLTLSSGTTPLEPSESLVYYYESEIDDDFINTATITATVTDDSGTALTDAADVTDTDTAQVREITPSVQIQKTVYQGHNNGASCTTGGELVTDVNGANVTYCFTVINDSAGNYLAITISDANLGITNANMDFLSGNLPLIPGGGRAVYYYETTINGDLENTATVVGNPVNSSNQDYANVANVTDSDTAEVDEVAPAIEIQKTVYVGDNDGASCPGSDLVTNTNGITLTYCFEVTNTGDTYLNNITIVDPLLGVDESGMSLAPGTSLVYSATTTLDGDLVNTATVTGNPSTANGTDLTGIANVTDSDTAQVNEVAPGVSIAKTVYLNINNGASCSTAGELVVGLNGNAITYCFVVTNSGDTYLDQIDLDDNELGIDDTDMTLLSGSTPLAPGASLAYYYESTITGDITNTVSVDANPTLANGTDLTGVSAVTDTDSARVDQVSPAVTLDKTVYLGDNSGASCPGSESVAALNGDDVTYCFEVTNTGDTYLNPSLTDTSLGISLIDMTVISGNLPLAAGESLLYYYVSEVDGDLVNMAEVTANPVDANFIDLPNIPNVSDEDTAEVNEVSPGIVLEKSVYLGVNGGASCPGSEVVSGRANASITYCFSVTNTSDTYLDVTLNDTTLGITDANMLPTFTTPLAPGASRSYFYQTTIITDVINIATAIGNPVDADGDDLPGLADVDDMNSAEVVLATPAVTLNKTVYAGVNNGASCATGGSNLIVADDNEPITYCFKVENNGNTYLNNIVLDDNDLGIDQTDMDLLSGSVPLAPNASLIYYYQTFVDGPLLNTADVTANPSDENGNDLTGIPNVTHDDTAEVSQDAPAIDIQKTVAVGADAACPGDEIVMGNDGDPVTYCFVITNTGQTHLDDIRFSDPVLGVTDVPLGGPLDPNATIPLTIGATINGPLLNTASVVGTPTDVSGTDLGLADVSDEDTAAVGQPALTLNKTVGVGHPQTGISCPADELGTGLEGTAIFYCFEVTNTGSTYLTGLMITDTLLGIDITDMTLDDGSLPLAPGASITYYYKSVITNNLVNMAAASATPSDANGDPLTGVSDVADDDTAEVQEVSSPNIALHKTVYAGNDNGATCPGVEFVNGLPGTDITYCFEVENTGDTFLSSITINDADLGITQANMTLVSGSLPLSPTASLIYYYETTLDGDLVNTANATGTPSDQNGNAIPGLTNVTDSDTATVEEASSPDVTIAKTVYSGHNSGTSCAAGMEEVQGVFDAEITYCFEVENTGDTYLSNIAIDDTPLGITAVDMTLLSGSTPLAPSASLVYYYETNMNGDLVNTAAVTATPSDQNGDDLGLGNVTDSDTAQADEVSTPDVAIQKTVYLGQDSGASCSTSVEFVEGQQGALMTYCFEIENTGDTYLGDIIIRDDPLSITQEVMTLVSGSVPIAPGQSAVYFYQTTVEEDLINTAVVDANPTNADGSDIADLPNVTDSDTAQISANIPTALAFTDLTANQEHGVSLAALLMLLAGGVAFVYQTILKKKTK